MTEMNALLDLILAQLTAILVHVPNTDLAKAQAAASQAIEAYSPQSASEPVDIAQIAALGFTALDTLRLAAPGDVTLTMKLRLRGNAVAMSRASRQATESLHRNRLFADPIWQESDEAPTAEAPEQPAAVDPAPKPTVQPTAQPWTTVLTNVAKDLESRTGKVSPAQQQVDRLWIEALNGTAQTLPEHQAKATGSRTNLMRTTLMAGGATLPPG